MTGIPQEGGRAGYREHLEMRSHQFGIEKQTQGSSEEPHREGKVCSEIEIAPIGENPGMQRNGMKKGLEANLQGAEATVGGVGVAMDKDYLLVLKW